MLVINHDNSTEGLS